MPNMDHVQAELMDMITKDVSPSQISDKIKDMLLQKLLKELMLINQLLLIVSLVIGRMKLKTKLMQKQIL